MESILKEIRRTQREYIDKRSTLQLKLKFLTVDICSHKQSKTHDITPRQYTFDTA